MATAEEILKKAENRKKLAFDFKPKKRRAWDFVFEKKEPKHEDILKYGNKIETIQEQYENNKGTMMEQSWNNTETILEQDRNKIGNKTGNKKESTSSKKIHSKNIDHENKISSQFQNNYNTTTGVLCIMHGIQNKIMRKIISHIKNQPNKNHSIDIPIAILAKKINASKESVRVSIKRLQKKNLLIRLHGEKGRYGNTKINIPENVVKKYFELFNDPPCHIYEYENNIGTISEQYINKYGNTNENNQNSSSGYNNIYKTTTADIQNVATFQARFSAEWENIDIEPLASISFTKTHLSQIAAQNKLTPQIVQDSIYAFAFDLQENDKAKTIKGDPINFFMGILRTGRVYTFPTNYESPQDKAMRIYRESKRKIEQGRAEVEKEAITLAFNEWFFNLTDEQKRGFLPEILRNTSRLESNKLLQSSARNHFEKEIWPNKKDEIIGNIQNTKKED